MIDILYIVSTLQNSGPTNQLFSLIKYLDRDQFSPRICTLSPEPASSRWEDFVPLGVSIETLGMGRFEGALRAKSALEKAIQHYAPHILHSHGLRADSLSIAAGRSIPKLCTVRNVPQMDYPLKFGKTRGSLMVKHHVSAVRRMDLAVGVSQAVTENMKAKFGVSSIVHKPNGADSTLYRRISAESRESARARLSIKPDETLVVSVGALNDRKDPVTVIRALSQVGEHSIRAYFLGDGPLMKTCKDLTKSDNRFCFCGNVDSAVSYLHAADLFVSASHSEGLPNSVLEAMACGVPVLLSDIGPHRELLPERLHGQLLFPVGSDRGLVESLRRAVSSDLSSLGEHLYQHFSQNFSAELMSKRYQDVYLRLAQG